MYKNIIVFVPVALLLTGFYLLLVDTPPSASSKANQRSDHVLNCMAIACNETPNCAADVVKACTDSAFNIYHDPTWEGEQTFGDRTINVIPSAIQEPVHGSE